MIQLNQDPIINKFVINLEYFTLDKFNNIYQMMMIMEIADKSLMDDLYDRKISVEPYTNKEMYKMIADLV